MRSSPFVALLGLSLAAAAGVGPAVAGTLTVNPVLVEIGAGQRSGAVTVTNVQDTPVTIRAYALSWRQEGGEDRYEDTTAMIVSPPIFTIPARGTQIVRVGPRAPVPGAQPYRLIIEEVPEATQGAGIRVALRLNLPLYARIAPGAAADLAWRASRGADGDWSLEARNGGGGWVRVDARTARAASGLAFEDGYAFGTVLPGGARRWSIGPNPRIADAARFRALQAGENGAPASPPRAR